MKVLLIWPGSRNEVLGWGDLGAVAEPLALEYLAAGAKSHGHEVQLLDLRLHRDELDKTLLDFAPDVVGVTAFSMHVLSALAICRRVKTQLPRCRTVVGGHHATLMPDDFFEPQVDFVVIGEGVRPFGALLQALSTSKPATDICGIWSRVDDRFVRGGSEPRFEMDALPMPDRSVTTHDRDRYFIDWMKPIALIRTTVGCPYRCNFCSLWKIMDGRYHVRDIERVVAELATIQEPFVFLVDDEAFINGRRMRRLAEALRSEALHKRYFAYCRIDTLIRERDVLAAWREVGLERLFIGIEAISEAGLAGYNKRLTLAQVERGLETADDLGIEVFAQFIVNTNYSRQDFKQLVRFIEHHKLRYPSFTILTPLPGTELLSNFDDVLERQPNGRPNWDLFDCQNAVTQTRLPSAEFRHEYRNLHRVFNGAYIQYREHRHMDGAGRPLQLQRIHG